MPRKKLTPYQARRAAANERNVSSKLCRCGRQIWVGLDADVLACTARVDTDALDAPGELLALASGRQSYRVRAYGDGLELDVRDRWQIRGEPAGGRVHVVADHVCEHVRTGRQGPVIA